MNRPPPSPDPIYVLRGLGVSITALEFPKRSTDKEQFLISGDCSGLVNIWNLESKRSETTLDGHNNKSILNVCYLSGDQILSQGRDGQVQIWNVHGGRSETTATVKVSDLGFCKCEILIDKNGDEVNIAASNNEQSQIDIISIKNKQVMMKLKPDHEKSLGMCMCLKKAVMEHDIDVLLAGYESGDIILWNIHSSKSICKLKVHKEPVMCLDFDSTSQRGVTGSAEDTLTVFKITEEGNLVIEKTVQVKNPGISAVRIRGDSKILATGGWDSKIRIFSWKSLRPLAILNYHTKSVDALAFSECSEKILAAGSKDGRISLWTLYKDT